MNIVFLVITTGKYHETRIKAVRETWAKGHEDKVYFFTDADGDCPQFIKLPVPSDYQSASIKTVLALRCLWENQAPPDWVVVCDDDTFIYMNNLQSFLVDKNPKLSACYGQVLRHYPPLPYLDYPSGGAGFVLSNMAFLQLQAPLRACNLYPFSDVTIGVCMSEVGIPLIEAPGMHSQPPEKVKAERMEQGLPGLTSSPLSFHYIQPERMYELYTGPVPS